MFKVTHVLCFSWPQFPFRVTGRVLAPIPATYKVSVPALDEPAHRRTLFWAFGGFGTLFKGTSAVLQMCTSTSSGASTSFNFLALVPGTTNPPLPSFVPHRLTSTSLIFLFCCCFSVIVRGIQQKYNLDVVKLKKIKILQTQTTKLPCCCGGTTTNPVWWISRDGSMRQFVRTCHCCVIRDVPL